MSEPKLTRSLSLILSVAVGVIAANLYYAQPLTAMIAASLGLEPEVAGLVVTLTQVGYGLGVLFLVPLADLVENRKLILTLLFLATLSLIGVGVADHVIPYFIAALTLGIGVSALQIIVPYAAHMSPEEKRGATVGGLMSGLMMGIMLSRPISGILTEFVSWHGVFYLSAALMMALGFVLYIFLPARRPQRLEIGYLGLLTSMVQIFARYPTLRRRSFYQAFMFAAFCLFWTATPLLLAGPDFHMSQLGIAIFALVGVGGAILAPIAGKMADRGLTQIASAIAMASGAFSFLLTHIVPLGSTTSLVLLTLSAILLDGGVSANLVLGQRTIFALPAEFRGRINSIYIATIFVGGAFGSFIGAWAFAKGQWQLTSYIGFILPLVALIYFATERFHVIKSSGKTGS